MRRRARHVVTENQRVLDFVAACRSGDLTALGPLLAASHASLRDAQNYVRAYTRGLGIFELPEYLAWPDWEQWEPLTKWLRSLRSRRRARPARRPSPARR